MGPQDSFHSARLMGSWIIDMADLKAAHDAIALCRSESVASLEVRHTLWGVQVRTDSDSAADFITSHYSPASGIPAVALAA